MSALRSWFSVVLAVTGGVVVVFLTLPVVAMFLRVPPGDLFGHLDDPVVVDALRVSLVTSLIAHAIILVLGTPAAYLLATRRFRGRSVVLTLTELPLVLPPAVAGIALLVTFGAQGLLGEPLASIGVSISLTPAAVVLAVLLVATPFYLRQAIAAFEAIDPSLADAARTLGARPWKVFLRVAIPLAAGGLGAGSTLAFARGLGEFGATIMFAGSVQGRTQTMPLMIYAQLGTDFDVALAVGALLVLVSIAILLTAKMLPSWTRFTYPPGTRSERSTSTSS